MQRNISPIFTRLLLVLVLAFSVSCDVLFPELGKGKKLLEVEIPAADTAVVIGIGGKIRVEIPPNAVPEGTLLRIYKPDDENLLEDETRRFNGIYNVEMSSGSAFDIPLKITLHYDSTLVVPGNIPNKIGAAWYRDDWERWSLYDSVAVDTAAHTVTFETNHLTKLSAWTLHGYTDWTSNRHFNIYWCSSGTSAPVADADYRPRENSDNPDDPLYIQDMSDYLDQAYDAFKARNLKLPDSKIDVWVTDLGGDDGQSTARGSIYISNNCSGGAVTRTALQALPSACAHELLHVSQDYYYVFTTARIPLVMTDVVTTLWWLEATATQADRMVWSNLAFYESDDYSDNLLEGQLHKAWDDCRTDPEWYTAGGFLSYLANHRYGNKADIAKLIVLGGAKTTAYFRTILDTYIKDELMGVGIGREYSDYVRWAYQGYYAPVTIQYRQPGKTNQLPWENNYLLDFRNNTAFFSQTLPPLSARIIRVGVNEDSDLSSTLTIDPIALPDGIRAFLYVDHEFYEEILPGQKTYRSLIKTPVAAYHKRHANILLINEHKDNDLNAKINLSITAQETQTLNFSEKIYGMALGEHGNNLMVSCNATVKGYKPVQILSIEQDATDLGDYITCRLIVHLSAGAFLGNLENMSIEFLEPGKLLVDKSATEGWKWEWQEFLGGTAEIVNKIISNYVYPTVGSGNTFTLTTPEGHLYQAGYTEVVFQAKTVKSVLGSDQQWRDQEIVYILKVLFQPPE
ncbi:MAG: hypothetical protein WC372_03225 [Candidatus Neomarinimicrobiota bacterium]|jgi:hypothetical protein|nr:hypothetical protein [Candidatus Neomarinimicrobiota bacterium]MDX9780078.1 hypothetical protein [bacterium]